MKRGLRNKLYSLWELICIHTEIWRSTLCSRLSLWFQGCACGPGYRSTGEIRIKARAAGSIRLGRDVRLLAHWRSNRVGMAGPLILHTWEGGSIEIGDHTGASAVVISSRSGIKIGSHCKLGGNVRIFDHDFHSLDAAIRRSPRDCDECAARPITLGDDVFVGAQSMILKGVTLGDRVVVGAGSVVTRSFPPDSIIAGNPAVRIR